MISSSVLPHHHGSFAVLNSAGANRCYGREEQWGRVVAALEAARAKRGGALLVEGPPGAGRTRLLADAVGAATQAGFFVAHGAADEMRRLVPSAALAAALGGTAEALSESGADPARLITWLHSRLEQRLGRGPVVVVLDDLQWADPVTLAALRTLVTRFAAHPLVWVLARRSEQGGASPVGRLFALLRETEGAELLRLRPLPDQAVAELAADRLGAAPAPELTACVRGADGNPAALVALLDGLAEEERVQLADGTARLSPGASGHPPHRFCALLRERMAAFQPATRLLLDVAAVLGRASTPDDIARMLDQPAATVLPALQEALDAGVLACEDDTIAFRHDLVRQALLATVPGPLRGALHRQAADMILGRPGGALPAAAHLVHGARRGDTGAAGVLGEAAAALVAAQPASAAELALRGLEIVDSARSAPADLVNTAVEALTRAGPLPRALSLADEALLGPLPPPHAARLRSALSTALLLNGRAAGALAAAEAVHPAGTGALPDSPGREAARRSRDERAATGLALIPMRTDTAPTGPERTAADWTFNDLRARAGLGRGRVAGDRAAGGAGPAGPWAADDVRARAGLGRGRVAGSGATTAGAAAVGPAGTAALTRVRALAALDVAAAVREGEALERGAGVEGEGQLGAMAALAQVYWRQGRLSEGLHLAREVVKRADNGAGTPWHLPPRLPLATMLVRLRESAEAAAVVEALAADIAGRGAPVLRGIPMLLGACAALAEGAGEQAVAQAREGLAAAEETGMPLYAPLGWGVLALEALRRGDLGAADEHVGRLREAVGTRQEADGARGGDGDGARHAFAAWIGAQLADARGDRGAVGAALEELHRDPPALRRLLAEEPAAAAWLVRTALRTGAGRPAAATARVMDQLAADNPDVPSVLVAAAHARGVREGDAHALRRAAEEHRDLWARASAAEDLGTLPGGARDGAVDALDLALAGYARLGADRDAARVRRRLRHLGVRRRHWRAAARPSSGWASLTETERRVAGMVAQGLTNRQVAGRMFLSPHTVGFHLRQIFRKLGIHSRIDLVRMESDGTDRIREAE